MMCGTGQVGHPLGAHGSVAPFLAPSHFCFWPPPEIHSSAGWAFGLPWMEQPPCDSPGDPSQELQEKQNSPASPPASVSLGLRGTSQHHSSSPSALQLLHSQAAKAASQMPPNTGSLRHILIFAETSTLWHFSAAHPCVQLFRNGGIRILSTANYKNLTHLLVKFTNTLNESGFLLVNDLCFFCCSGNAVPNNMDL